MEVWSRGGWTRLWRYGYNEGWSGTSKQVRVRKLFEPMTNL
jgi:hypothetical protein